MGSLNVGGYLTANSSARLGAGTALVTGASRGIGEAVARRLARDGWGLVLAARSGSALERLRVELIRANGVEVHVVATDLGMPGASASLLAFLEQRGLTLDLLVNNAGQGEYGEFARCSPDRPKELIQLNVVALTELTRAVLPGMIGRRRGTVLNVASTAALRPGPWLAVYGATKAYVISLTESLACELEGTGVRVVAICPGPTTTSFREVAGMGVKRSPPPATEAKPSEVADFAMQVIAGRESVVVHGFRNRLAAVLSRWLPRSVQARLVLAHRSKHAPSR